jgi:hypothetical protein
MKTPDEVRPLLVILMIVSGNGHKLLLLAVIPRFHLFQG